VDEIPAEYILSIGKEARAFLQAYSRGTMLEGVPFDEIEEPPVGNAIPSL
jgi:hypothetical protein